MNLLARFAPSDELARFLLGVSLMILGLILVAAVVSGMALRGRPAARHGLWLSTLVLVALSPLIVASSGHSGIGRWTVEVRLPRQEPGATAPESVALPPGPERTEIIESVGPGDLDAAQPVEIGRPAAIETEAPLPARSEAGRTTTLRTTSPPWTRDDLAGLAVLIWLAGLAFGLARLGAGCLALRALRRTLRPLDREAHAGVLARVREVLGVRELPPIFTSTAVAGPFAAGLFRPGVVVPTDLDERELRDVLIHECAHVIRRDLWVGLLQRVVAVVLWPHLAVHYLNRQLGRAREEVCDNFVLRVDDARGYARTLLALTERRPTSGLALGIVGTRWTLADRVAGLLDPERNRMTRSSLRVRIATLASLIGVVLALAAIRFEGPTALAADLVAPESQASASIGRQVGGVVVDEAGRPVAGAIVRPFRLDKAPEGVTSAEDGRFTMALRGYFLLEEELIAEADGGARMGLGKFHESLNSDPPSPAKIVLKPSRSITVRVKDVNGAAVPGAAVEVADYSCLGRGQTALDGSATIRFPADGQVRWVLARKAGVGFDYFENYRTKHAQDLAPPPDEVALVLDGARSVRIKAVDSSGQPVSGITFLPWYIDKPGKLEFANIGGSTTGRATTGADGVATFDWLPTRVNEGVPFLIHDDNYSCPESPVYQGDGATELTARLLRNERISGIVRQADGRPAAGVLIQAEGRGATNHYCRKYARTGPDGRYAIDVYSDQMYVIAVSDDRWAARSLTNVTVREGHPQDGLDFNLIRGTLLEGRVTRGTDRVPAVGKPLSLIQDGASVLEGPGAPIGGKDGEQTLVRFATTDAQGRYHFRIGPGRYRVLAFGVSNQSTELVVENPNEATVVRDFHLAEPDRPRMFEGRVVEKAAGGDRPLADAMVEAVGLGNRQGFSARADAEGRFRGPRRDDGPLVIYARSLDGKLAGFTLIPGGLGEGLATVTPASKVSGRVVDRSGQPRGGYRVQVKLESGPDFLTSGRVFRHVRTDDRGRYTLDGAVVGSFGEAWATAEDFPRSYLVDVQRFEIKGEDPVEVPDLTIPPGALKQPGPAPAAVVAPATRRIEPTVTSRSEIEGLIRAIGRDPTTPELVDRLSLRFLPHMTWAYDLAETRRLATDAEFVERIDAISRDVLGKPADTLTLVEEAVFYHVGRDDAGILGDLNGKIEARKQEPATIEGTVDDQKTGRPLAGALVHTDEALTRTDDQGRFTLLVRSRPGWSFKYWVDARGYTIREVTIAKPEADRQAIHLLPEAPFEGQILDPEGRPIAGASLRAWVDRAAVIGHEFDTRNGGANSFILTARTDDQGRFSIPGVPPSKLPVNLQVSHPDHLSVSLNHPAPTSAESPLVIRMKPGAVVGGIVVDEQGRGVPGAWVELRRPSDGRGIRSSTHTDDQGRYRFRNVATGRWSLVVEPEKFAPVLVPIVADLARPVENQVVVPPGSTIRGKVVDAEGRAVAGAAVGWIESLGGNGFELNRMTLTATDGTFKIGPLPSGEFRLTGLAESPRRLGKLTAKANQADVLIRLEPAPIPK
jgi:beta-lactamase regulating signal transducer with metallopeptidase domain/protocatechuate 3,4-dioxygenase beta subunit